MNSERHAHAATITRIDTRVNRSDTPTDPEVIIRSFQRSPLGRYYVDNRTLHKYRQSFNGLGRFLGKNVDALDILSDAHGQPPHDDLKVTMLIIPDYPLVLSQFGRTRAALVPIVMCTLNALDDVWESRDHGKEKYDIITTQHPFMGNESEPIVKAAWKSAMDGQLFFLDYHPDLMKPEQYLAFPAVGGFNNEAYFEALAQAPLAR